MCSLQNELSIEEREKTRKKGTGAAGSDPRVPRSGTAGGGLVLRSADSQAAQSIVKSTSRRAHLVDEARKDRIDQAIDALVTEEALEDELLATTEETVYAFRCSTCRASWAQGISDVCKKQHHKLEKKKVIKRYFACTHCKKRMWTFNSKFPVKPCEKCGNKHYDKAGKIDQKVVQTHSDRILERLNQDAWTHKGHIAAPLPKVHPSLAEAMQHPVNLRPDF